MNSITEKIREKKRRFLAREQSIVDAATALFLSEGIDQVTVSQIARRAGIGKGTVYKHFQSKSEIMVRIVLEYEQKISRNLALGIEANRRGDPGAAAGAYFKSRLENPAKDRLVQQLEMRLESNPEVIDQLQEVHTTRRSSASALNDMVEALIEKGVLEEVPPYYHYLAAWALVQGAVEACFHQGFADQFDDKEDLLEFIARIGITMGNKGQLRKNK